MKKYFILLVGLIFTLAASAGSVKFERPSSTKWKSTAYVNCIVGGSSVQSILSSNTTSAAGDYYEFEGIPDNTEQVQFQNTLYNQETDYFTYVDGGTYTTAGLVVSQNYTVKFDNGKTAWEKVYATVSNGSDWSTWPGYEMTLEEGTVWTLTFVPDFVPTIILFNDGAAYAQAEKSEELTFEDGKTYGEPAPPVAEDGVVNLVRPTSTKWKSTALVDCYVGETLVKTIESAAAAAAGDFYVFTTIPQNTETVMFHTSGYTDMTDRFDYVDGATYTTKGIVETHTYTISFDNGKTAWDKVYATVSDGNDWSTWPGYEMTVGAGTTIWSVTFTTTMVPTVVVFNDGADYASAQKTDELAFEDGKTYGEPAPANGTVRFERPKSTKWKSTAIVDCLIDDVNVKSITSSNTTAVQGDFYEFEGIPDNTAQVLFHTAGYTTMSPTFDYVDGGTYTMDGLIIEETYTVKFDNGKTAWDKVYVTIYENLSGWIEWPGYEMTLEEGTIWTATFKPGFTPTYVMFHNEGSYDSCEKTEEFAFEDGKTYGDPVPSFPDLYVVGDRYGWSTASQANLMASADGLVYTFTVPEGMRGQWRISNSKWDYYFGPTEGQPEFGVEFPVSVCDNNFTIESTSAMTITLTLPEIGATTATILVEGEFVPDVITYCLNGCWKGTAEWSDVVMTENAEGLWVSDVIKFKYPCNFSIKVLNHGEDYGAIGPDGGSFEFNEDNLEAMTKSNQARFASTLTGEYFFTFNPEAKTLTAEAYTEPEEALDTIETESATPLYFNLQGLRIERPANGTYIVKRGSKVTKEHISAL